jgi:hypothetical protein
VRVDDVHALLDDGELQEVVSREPGAEDQLSATPAATDERRQSLKGSAESLEHLERTVEEVSELADVLR